MPTKHRSTIHKFPGRLPYNVNVVRDVNWSEDTDTPTGHHTLNCLLGDVNGATFSDRLKEIKWSDSWRWKIVYREIVVERRRRVSRSIQGGTGFEDETHETVTLPWDLD
jgi:hypothetical protein